MRKILMLMAITILLVWCFGTVSADVALAPEVDITMMRLYDAEVFNQDIEIEYSAQTYLLGADIKLGNLLITPKVGVQSSMLEVAEMIELENDLGLAAGIDIEYGIFEIGNFSLILGGSYLYSQSEVDEIKIISSGAIIDNSLRNDLICHSYEVGAKIVASDLPIPIKPYIGIVYADSDMSLSTDNLPVNLEVEAEAAKNLGLRLGAEGSPIESMSVKVEAKLLDQTAVMGSVAWKF